MLSTRTTPTRDVVGLDGLWRFALDTSVGERPWESRLGTTLEADTVRLEVVLLTCPVQGRQVTRRPAAEPEVGARHDAAPGPARSLHERHVTAAFSS